MHPYHFHHMAGFHRGPSRILWFFLGGLAATWWIKRKDADHRVFGHCNRPSMQGAFPGAPPFNSDVSDVSQPSVSPNDPNSPCRPPRGAHSWPQNVSGNSTSEVSFSGGANVSIGDWELEKDHIAKISRQAADAVRVHFYQQDDV